MFPQSIRWRLPLSYAAIAFLAIAAMGSVLLATLRDYYEAREQEYLQDNAIVISRNLSQMYEDEVPVEAIQSLLANYAFVARARVRVLDSQQQQVADSGEFSGSDVITFGIDEQPPNLIVGQAGMAAQPVYTPFMSVLPEQVHITEGARFEEPVTTTLMIASAPSRYSVSFVGSPFGYRLDPERASESSHSDEVILAPIWNYPDGYIRGYVELSQGPAYGTEVVNSVARALLIAGMVAVMVAGGVGWLISLNLSNPVLALAEVTRRMAGGQLSARAEINRRDEFGVLAASFNEMAHRVESTIHTLRQFVGDAAHEFHTPITAVNTNLELAATEDDAGKRHAFIQRAQSQLKRLQHLTDSLLDLARLETNTNQEAPEPIDLLKIARQSHALYASRAEQAGLTLNADLPEQPIMVQGHENQLQRVIDNLLDNAIKFTPEDGTVQLGVCQLPNYAEVLIKDTGIGIPPEDVPLLFSRFHRGRNAAAYPGNGLGLAIIKAIVEGHGGQIQVESNDGTCFSVRIPIT